MGTWRIIAMLVWLTGNLTLPPQDKSAVPPESEIKAAEKTLQQAYKVEFSTQDRVARRAATVKLLSDASAIKSQPEQYALLQAVITMALGVQDPWTSLRAAEQIDKRFTVNLAELKAQIVAAAKKQATAPLDAMIATEFCLTLWESSLEAGDFENAIAWGKTAEQLAKSAKDPALAQSAKDMTAEAEQCKKDRERSLVAETALGTGSDDPAAHTDLGIYLCFVRADWDKGCLHLSKGIEGSLKELAVKEQLKLTDAESKLGISMAWRTAGEREKITHIRKRFLVRSCYWQEEALKAADPVTKRKIAKKIAGSAVLLKGTYAMGKSSSDVTAKMQEVLENDPRAPFIADYYVAGPQQPGEARGITVECQQGKDWVEEHRGGMGGRDGTVHLDSGNAGSGSHVPLLANRAHYCAGLSSVDVTDLARAAIPDPYTFYTVGIAASDPFPGKHKSLVIQFDCHGRRFIRRIGQEEKATLIQR